MERASNVLWARREFGRAELGDTRRLTRLIRVGATLAGSPAGRVTEAFRSSAEREGAYRLLENDAVDSSEIAKSIRRATANRCFGEEIVFLPLDETTLSLCDRVDRRGLGIINKAVGARGLHVMSAIAVKQDRTPIGICGQQYWARRKPVGRGPDEYDPRKVEEKETQHWLDVMEQAQIALDAEAPQTRRWFQLDRGGDAWPILRKAVTDGDWLTVRAQHSRRLMTHKGGRRRDYLWGWLASQEPQGSYVLPVPAGKGRTARHACMHLQFSAVTLEITDKKRPKQKFGLSLWAVRVVEVGTTPRGETH